MTLLFVYNANSGKWNGLFDMGHKIWSPSTYSCQLCSLTHGLFIEHKLWKRFRAESVVDMQFYHKDEFEAKYPNLEFSYPIILRHENNALQPFLEAERLNAMASLEELIASLEKELK